MQKAIVIANHQCNVEAEDRRLYDYAGWKNLSISQKLQVEANLEADTEIKGLKMLDGI